MLALDPYYEMFPTSYQRSYPWYGLGDAAAEQRAQNTGIDYDIDYTVVRNDVPNSNLYRVVDFYEDPSTLKLSADVVIHMGPNFKRGLRFPIETLRRATEADRLRAPFKQIDPFVGDLSTSMPSVGVRIALGVGAVIAVGVGSFFLGRMMR